MAKNKYDKEQIGGWHMRSLHLIKKIMLVALALLLLITPALAETNDSETTIQRKPSVLTKSGRASATAISNDIHGTFYANYNVCLLYTSGHVILGFPGIVAHAHHQAAHHGDVPMALSLIHI